MEDHSNNEYIELVGCMMSKSEIANSFFLGNFPIVIEEPNTEDYSLGQLQLLAKWQRHLELRPLIRAFYQELKKLLKIESIAFSSAYYQAVSRIGETAKSTYVFQLSYDEEIIAVIKLGRSKAFSNEEIMIIVDHLEVIYTQLKNALNYHQAKNTALVDPLTGAANRVAFSQLHKRIKPGKIRANHYSVLVIDIDRFKSINDQYGHLVGDAILKAVTHIILKQLRKTDKVYRIGGEEFFVTLQNTHLAEAKVLADRICKSIANSALMEEYQATSVTVSIGIACIKQDDTLSSLFERADMALYNAKHRGGNCYIDEKKAASSA